MTGNLVLLGLALGRVEVSAVERSAVALAGFAVGALLASILTRSASRDAWPSAATAALGVEAGLLVAFAGLWVAGATPDGLIVLAALGMGVQSGAVRQLAVPGVTTTFVTGTITVLMA